MIEIKKSTLRKTGIGAAALLLIALLVIVLSPGQVSFAEGPTCGDGICSASENSDLCGADCGCVDNGVADPGEGCGCKDVVCDNELLSSACGTLALITDDEGNWQCPSGTATDGTTQSLAEFKGVCWDACECEGKCTEEEISEQYSCPGNKDGRIRHTNVPNGQSNPCKGGWENLFYGYWICTNSGYDDVSPNDCCSGVVIGPWGSTGVCK